MCETRGTIGKFEIPSIKFLRISLLRGLFTDAVCNQCYTSRSLVNTASGRICSRYNLEYYFRHLPGGTEENYGSFRSG
jgi:hypothetical protein